LTLSIGKKGVEFRVVPERLRGDIAKVRHIVDKEQVIVAKDKRITVKHP
jgi:DNA-directed RNA polymerase subunit beta